MNKSTTGMIIKVYHLQIRKFLGIPIRQEADGTRMTKKKRKTTIQKCEQKRVEFYHFLV